MRHPKDRGGDDHNHWSHTKSQAFTNALGTIGAGRITIRPHCPRQNGEVERFNRTLRAELAYRQISSTNSERAEALQP